MKELNNNLSSLQEQKLKNDKELNDRELARRHFKDFVNYTFKDYQWNWHNELLCDALEKVVNGEIKRLMIEMPPRHGKSELASIRLPAWFIGKMPDKEIIAVSYGSDLASDFGREVRNLIKDIKYRNLFLVRLSEDSDAKNKWNTIQDGSYIATGIGGSVTGKGADLLLIDDPFKDRAEADSKTVRDSRIAWYQSVARTRLSPNGAIVIINTRWHDGDLSGHLLKLQEEDPMADKWHRIKLPAIATKVERYRGVGEALWPQRWSLSEILKIKANIGVREFAALYQQDPVDDEFSEFKRRFFQYITEEEIRKKKTNRFLTIDSAITKNDNSAYTGFTDNRVDSEGFWHIRAWRERLSSKELMDKIFDLHKLNKYDDIGVEKTLFSQALSEFYEVEMRRRKIFLPLKYLSTNNTSKDVRVRGITPYYESHSVYHIKGWCEDLEDELIRFPSAEYRDLTDSLAHQKAIVFYPGSAHEDKEANAEEREVKDEFGLFPELGGKEVQVNTAVESEVVEDTFDFLNN